MAENSVEIQIIAIDAASDILAKIGDSFGVLGQVATAAIGAIGGAFKTLIDAGMDEADVVGRFNSLVDNSPLADYKAEMEKLATAQSLLTRFEEDSILAAEGQLAIYTNIGKDVFPQVLAASLDLATFMKTDATAAAQTLGRAFEDIAGGSLTMLGRQRLLTKEQRDMAQEMAKAGDVAGAQAYVLDILNGKIGTLAEDMGKTFPGQMEIFNNTWREWVDQQGLKFLNVLEPLMADLVQLESVILPILTDAFDKYFLPVMENIVGVFDLFAKGEINFSQFVQGLVTNFQGIWGRLFGGMDVGDLWVMLTGKLKDAIGKIDWKGVGDAFASAIRGVDWGKLTADAITGTTNIGQAIAEALMNPDFWAGLDSITLAINDAITRSALSAREMVLPALAPAAEQFAIFCAKVRTIVANGAAEWVGVINARLSTFAPLFYGIITNNWNPAVFEALTIIKKTFYNQFQGAMQQAIRALNDMVPSVIDAIGQVILDIMAAIGKGVTIPISFSGLGGFLNNLFPNNTPPATGGGGGGGSGGRMKAAGGDVYAGVPYIVGEAGPEVFVPQASGSIVPNDIIRGAIGGTLYNYGTITLQLSRAESRSLIEMLRK